MKKKVLVIEDDPAISDYAVLVLKKRNFEVEKASDGYSGVEAAKTFKPDVVVLDLMMPGMHGYEVCETLRRDKSLNGLKILITSSKSYAADMETARNAGADAYLTKPYRAEELEWFQEHVATTDRVSEAPFRVIVMHQPRWGWLTDGPDAWIQTANDAGVDLVIAGHRHRFSYTPPTEDVEHAYHLLVVGQDQVARVDATSTELRVVVTGTDGSVVHTIVIPRR